MKYVIIEYDTAMKQTVKNRLYFSSKKDIQEKYNISESTLNNFLLGRIKGKKKTISQLATIDIFRRYNYKSNSIENVLRIGLKDLEECFLEIKRNLRSVHSRNSSISSTNTVITNGDVQDLLIPKD